VGIVVVRVKERFEVVASRRSDGVWWENTKIQLFSLCKFVSQHTSIALRCTCKSVECIMYDLSIFAQPGVSDALDAVVSAIQRQRRDGHTCKSDPKYYSSHISDNYLNAALEARSVLKVVRS
jgi:hypothetical protein